MLSFVLFLDFDGVLSPGNTGTLRDADALRALLDEVLPQARVVLSTNWREHETLQDLRGWLPEGLARRVIDGTPVLNDGRMPGGRQREIEAWLRHNPAAAWLALDDCADLYAVDCPWLFLTRSRDALDKATLDQLQARLARVAAGRA